MDKGFYPRVVVSDFGLCMEIKELEELARNKRRVPGTPMYLPPETTTSKTRLYPIAGPAIDIWAAGITLYYMFTVAHFVPKGSVTAPPEAYTDQFFRDVWQFLQGKGVSQLAINVLQRCLRVDPTQRVTAKDALNLTWFKKFEPIGSNTQAQGSLVFSPAGIVDRPLADTEASNTVVCLGAKRPHSEPVSDAGEDVGKGKAPAQKRRALADGS